MEARGNGLPALRTLSLDSDVDVDALVASLLGPLEHALREAMAPSGQHSPGGSMSPRSLRHMRKQHHIVEEITDMAAELSPEQLTDAREVFSLFDKDGKGVIGRHELHYALGKLGQHATNEEVDAIIDEFDMDRNGQIDFQEFLQMMRTLGWDGWVVLPESELKKLRVSYYGQAAICRWLDDANERPGSSGDVLGPDIGSFTATCRRIAMANSFEIVIYACILIAAVISGMQSYKPNSEYEHAEWAVAADSVILFVFTSEIAMKIFAEDSKYPHHFFWDSWNTFDFVVCTMLVITSVIKTMDTVVAPFRLIRLLRAVRLLRTVRLFPNLAIVVETTVKSASSVIYIGLFGMLFTYMFAIVGVAAFGVNDPFYFGNLGRALLTLFRVISMDSWSMIMYYNIWGCGQPNFDGPDTHRGYGDYYTENGMDCVFAPSGMFAAVYFVLFMCTVAFLILNLFIGIITTEMQDAKAEVERQRKVSNKLAMAVTLRMRNISSPKGGGDGGGGGGGGVEDVNPLAESFDVEDGRSGGSARKSSSSKEPPPQQQQQQKQQQNGDHGGSAPAATFDAEPVR